MADLIAAGISTVALAVLLLVNWVGRERAAEAPSVARISQHRGDRKPEELWVSKRTGEGVWSKPVPVNAAAIREELARTTDPDVRDVLLDKLIEATRERAA